MPKKMFPKFIAFEMIWSWIYRLRFNKLDQEYSDANITQSIKVEFFVKKQKIYFYTLHNTSGY